MDKLVRLNEAGLVDPPVYPCYKEEGLCQLRTKENPDRFVCEQTAEICSYFRKKTKIKGKKEIKNGLVGDL